MLGKSRNAVFFMIRVSGQSKSRPVKAAGAESGGQFRCRKIVRHCGETYILKSKCTKQDVFGPLLYVLMLKKCTRLWRKAHLEVKIFKTCGVQSTFGRADVENLHAAEAKSILGSEHVLYMLKKCTRLWRKAHLEVKIFKTCGVQSTFRRADVENLYDIRK